MLSIIIPTYKEPDYLDLCLGSIYRGIPVYQPTNIQIIVVVDGFYEINKAVLDNFTTAFHDIGYELDTIIFEENQGLAKATNAGVYQAKYESILIVNDDNVFPYNWADMLHYNHDLHHKNNKIVYSLNQVEPYPSMFKDFICMDFGKSPAEFDILKWKQYTNINNSNNSIGKNKYCGSTLPILMNKFDYLSIGGWDENYPGPWVTDWDFFLKCNLQGFAMVRLFDYKFYHFASAATRTVNTLQDRTEESCHEYAKYKWGDYIKHDPITNLKYL